MDGAHAERHQILDGVTRMDELRQDVAQFRQHRFHGAVAQEGRRRAAVTASPKVLGHGVHVDVIGGAAGDQLRVGIYPHQDEER